MPPRPLPLLAAALLLTAPAHAAPLTLLGTVGKLPIVVSLERTGDALSGWYFYTAQAKSIALEGHIDAAGHFALREHVADKETGRLEGTLGGTLSSTHWQGTWRKDAHAEPLPLQLDAAGSATALDGQISCSDSTHDHQYGYDLRNRLKLTINKGHVTAFEARQSSTSTDGDIQQCELALSDLLPEKTPTGILLRPPGDTPQAPGPHCSVRIVGNADTLWLRLGDASESNNDCRSTADTMYCSPRAFWSDVLVDRRTGACKRVR